MLKSGKVVINSWSLDHLITWSLQKRTLHAPKDYRGADAPRNDSGRLKSTLPLFVLG